MHAALLAASCSALSLLHCVAAPYSVSDKQDRLQNNSIQMMKSFAVRCSVLVCCRVLQCVAMCRANESDQNAPSIMLQCVAVRSSALNQGARQNPEHRTFISDHTNPKYKEQTALLQILALYAHYNTMQNTRQQQPVRCNCSVLQTQTSRESISTGVYDR